MSGVTERHIVPEGNYNIRIQEYAATVFELLSTRNAVKKALKNKELYINNSIANSSDWITAGMEICYIKHPKPIKKVFPLILDILYEDPYLAVIFKPSGYPTNGNYYKTIENALPYNLIPSHLKDALDYPRPVHRLDNPTSGLLLVAKTATIQRELHYLFEANKIEKTYYAVVAGRLHKQGTISAPINTKESLTTYQVLREVPSLQNKYLSLVELHPKTGRTHQLRIHMAQQNTPIVGDRLYAPSNVLKHKGLFLCAAKLIFHHPILKERIELQATLPEKFTNYLNREETRFKKYQS